MLRPRFCTTALLAGISLLSLTTACSTQDRERFDKKAQELKIHDREVGYNRNDFRRAMAPRPAPAADKMDGVPALAPVISDDRKTILPQPLVSVTVNQDVPIRDIFYELAKQAEVDLELDPTITGSIIFTAYNRPFDQVVERICDMAGLRFTFKNNVLRVERDTPYVKTYHVGYLSVQRDHTSTINSNTSAASSGGGGGGGQNGSSSTVTTTSTTDFWNELETNITQIIRNTNQQVSLSDQSTPIVMTPQAIPALTPDQLTSIEGAAPTAAPTSVTVNMTAPTPGLANPTGIPAATTGTGAAPAAAPAGGGGVQQNQNPYYSVNRQAGMINVFASDKQQRKIGEYIKNMLESINTQVLIEAKVFEVELNDEHSTGVDWRLLGSEVSGGISLAQQNFVTNPFLAGAGAILNISNDDFSVMVNLISRFGTVRTLSSPRLSVMNNQTAVLNVSESRVFFDLDLQRTDGTITTPPRVDITSEVRSVPEGVIITVHPSVDPDTNEITMNLRPSITRVVRTVADPAVALIAQQSNLNIESLVPELSIREIDSMVKMNSGTAIIMGGLMQDRSDNNNVSVPGLGEIPVFGSLFRSKREITRKTEMIIMLRAVVINNAKPDQTDRELYNNLAQDRRPFPL